MASGNAGHRTHVLCGRHEGRTWGPEAGGPAQLRAVRTWQCQRAVPCTKRAQAWRLKAAPICHFHSQGLEVWLSWSFVRVSDGDNPGVAPCAFIWRSAGGEKLLPSSFGGWQDLCPWGCVTKDPAARWLLLEAARSPLPRGLPQDGCSLRLAHEENLSPEV